MNQNGSNGSYLALAGDRYIHAIGLPKPLRGVTVCSTALQLRTRTLEPERLGSNLSSSAEQLCDSGNFASLSLSFHTCKMGVTSVLIL